MTAKDAAEKIKKVMSEALPTGVMEIARERQRQIDEEGWALEHDQQHVDGDLALVAALYASPVQLYTVSIEDDRKNSAPGFRGLDIEISDPWPDAWPSRYDKREKHDRIRRLVIAGALIAAEIDRLRVIEAGEGVAP